MFRFDLEERKGESKGLEVLETLLKLGADPNEIYKGYSIWQYFIHALHSQGGMTYSPKMLILLLKHGADVEICCLNDTKHWESFFSGDGDEYYFYEMLKKRGMNHISKSESHGNVLENPHCLESVIKDCAKYSRWRKDELDELCKGITKVR